MSQIIMTSTLSLLPNLLTHIFPEICIEVTVINFTIITDGLEDQLLVDVVKYEQPEL